MTSPRWVHIAIVFSVMAAGHFLSVAVGLYDVAVVWVDKLWHMLAGVGVGMLAIVVLRGSSESRIRSSRMIWRVLLCVVLAAVGWEGLEYAFWRLFHETAAGLKLFSPSVGEAAGDVVANVAGGAVYCALLVRAARRTKRGEGAYDSPPVR